MWFARWAPLGVAVCILFGCGSADNAKPAPECGGCSNLPTDPCYCGPSGAGGAVGTGGRPGPLCGGCSNVPTDPCYCGPQVFGGAFGTGGASSSADAGAADAHVLLTDAGPDHTG